MRRPAQRTAPHLASPLYPDEPNIHSIKNISDGIAVSIHMYLIDGYKQPAAVDTVYQQA